MPAYQQRIRFLGLCVDNLNVQELHSLIENTIRQNQKACILHLNIHGACLAWDKAWLADFYNQSALVYCDGDGIRFGLKLLGNAVPPKITSDRWIWQLSEFAAGKGLSFYFLGGKPGIAKTAAERLKNKYPMLKILGEHHGYFEHSGDQNQKVVDEINRLKPDIVVIGFGMPLQEKWLMDNAEKVNAHIFLTEGAVFEYAAGTFKRAPEWMIARHLEWFFRMFYDPRRLLMRYATEIPYFFCKVFMERLKIKKGRKEGDNIVR